MTYWILGIVIGWFACGICGYFVMRADFKKIFHKFPQIESWSKDDSCMARRGILFGPAFLIAAIICAVLK